MQIVKSFLFFVLFSFSSLIFAAPVNINTADSNTISTELTGIGQSKAEAIVAYREKHGPFQTVEDLARVKGIGKATIEKNKEKILIQ